MSKERQSFCVQRWHAGKRGIAWELSFDEWMLLWDGKFHLRGKGKGKLCMARYGDEGPYSISNVYITKNEINNLDQTLNGHSKIPRQIVTLLHDDGRSITFPSKGQASKFFGRVNNGLPEALLKGNKFQGWQYVK